MPESIQPFHPSHHLHYHTGSNISLISTQVDIPSCSTFSSSLDSLRLELKKEKFRKEGSKEEEAESFIFNNNNAGLLSNIHSLFTDLVVSPGHSNRYSLMKLLKKLINGDFSAVSHSRDRNRNNRDGGAKRDNDNRHVVSEETYNSLHNDKVWIQTGSLIMLSLLFLLAFTNLQSNRYTYLNNSNNNIWWVWERLVNYQLNKINYVKQLIYGNFEIRSGIGKSILNGLTSKIRSSSSHNLHHNHHHHYHTNNKVNIFGEFNGDIEQRFAQFDLTSVIVVSISTLLFSIMLS